MKKLNILIITQDYPPPYGGIQTFTYDLENGYRKEGHNVTMLSFDGRHTSNFSLMRVRDLFYTEATKNDYFRISKLINPIMLFKLGGYRDFIYQNMIYRITSDKISKIKPDIIHLTNAKLYSAIYNKHVPFIVSCHSEEIVDQFPIKYTLLNANRIHCVTEFTKNLVLKITPERKNDIKVIYTGIDIKSFSIRSKRKNQIITLCRLEKRKNVGSIINAYSLLPSEIKNKYKYIIAGDGSERENLEKLVRRLKLSNNIIFIGSVSESYKRELLAESKLYVMCPTLYMGEQEGFGITYIEAQAAGIPVIGSKIGGATEAIRDCGIIVTDENNPSEIASKITQILSDKRLYDKCKTNIKKGISGFDKEGWIDRMEAFLYSVLENKSPGHAYD